MGLSDCGKCWNTPCDCGHEYSHYSQDRFVEFITGILSKRDKNEAEKIIKMVLIELEYREK